MAERPEDLNLPNAVIARIIKDALPDGVNIGKDARLAISKAASVFVLYATSCANNFAMKGKRKTISAQDVLLAMNDMEFERFVGPLKEALEAFKNEQKSKKQASEQKKKAKEAAANGGADTEAMVTETEEAQEEEAPDDEGDEGEGEEEGEGEDEEEGEGDESEEEESS
ncbi:DNA polymerase epsilon subunit 3-like [Lineus longissimus]|uniref:DNA polymerase epsilon subunit 3-like n=1 Tax=Lineus longissimus TaxID=88925 RepID=UPI002B4E0C20